jgi:hypothetical protein
MAVPLPEPSWWTRNSTRIVWPAYAERSKTFSFQTWSFSATCITVWRTFPLVSLISTFCQSEVIESLVYGQ